MKIERDPSLSSAGRLQPGGELLARRATGHRTWAGTIADRFKQRSVVSGWSPASLIYRRLAGRVFVSFRHVSHFHTQRISLPAQPIVNNSFAHTTVRTHGASIPQAALLHRQFGPGPPTSQQSGSPLKILARHFWLDGSVLRRTAVPYSSAPAASSSNIAPTFVDALRIKRWFLKQETLRQDEPSSGIAMQILRRLQRVEERPATMPADSAAETPGIQGAGNFVLEASRGAPVREIRPVSGSDTVPTSPTFAPFNVTQLTDEVMRQLDRRLIAARERLGRM